MARQKLHTSLAWMRRKYLREKLSEDEIAELAGVDRATVNRWLRRLGLKKDR